MESTQHLGYSFAIQVDLTLMDEKMNDSREIEL